MPPSATSDTYYDQSTWLIDHKFPKATIANWTWRNSESRPRELWFPNVLQFLQAPLNPFTNHHLYHHHHQHWQRGLSVIPWRNLRYQWWMGVHEAVFFITSLICAKSHWFFFSEGTTHIKRLYVNIHTFAPLYVQQAVEIKRVALGNILHKTFFKK